jgi:tetratricopeptide (TPR) repeat protein
MLRSQQLTARRFRVAVVAFLCLLLAPVSASSHMRAPAQDDERARALKMLWDESRPEDALPLLEKLAAARPDDGEVIFSYGMALFGHAKLLKDADARSQTRVRARNFFLKAKELGVTHPLLASILESLPPDGGADDVFSLNKVADGAMRDGEAAYVRGDFAAAAAFYQRALEADPKLYEAALFTGDMLLKLEQYDKSAEWYTRAIQINPDRETAYRYSATPLMRQHKYDEAKARYVEAFIAEPYNRLARSGLIQWAQTVGVTVGNPQINIPSSVSPLKDNKITINVDPAALGKDDGSSAWLMYGITRSAWATKKFAETFPTEKSYRHSLREEADALRMVVESVKTQQKDGKIKALAPDLAVLVKLADDGLLEPYILIARPDEGIAQDFAEYRKGNRDKLRRYVMDYVIGRAEK